MNNLNQVPNLRTSRRFPEEAKQLSIELEKAYIDIANAVNNRTIGLYGSSRPSGTGNSYFVSKNQRQQEIRQVYSLTSTAPIPHGLNLSRIDYFTNNFGSFTDGTNWYGLIYAGNVAIAGQISFFVGPTNITFLTGAAAPTVTKGIIVLQWISVP
jgi:hypothetical protein